MGIRLPSSPIFPGPAATTLPSCGFSFAVSGMMIPPAVLFSSSTLTTKILSFIGLIFMTAYLLGEVIARSCAAGWIWQTRLAIRAFFPCM
jgi:hypothetical protein